MRLNLSDEPLTAELIAESLGRSETALIGVNGTSMHPTLQMGWRVFVRPATGPDLKIGEIAVFRGERYLTIHRLVWRESGPDGTRLVFRGDYNRVRERVPESAVIARVVAIEIPGRRKGMERVISIETDLLARFYRAAYGVFRLLRPILPSPPARGAPIGPFGRAARTVFAGIERLLGLFLRGHR